MIAGVIRDENQVYKRKVSVNPITHHYENDGKKPKIKYGCPVCEAVGNKAQILPGTESCPLCNVSLNWDRKPEIGDEVIVRSPGYADDERYVIMEDNTGKPGMVPYVLKYETPEFEKWLKCGSDEFTILDKP